MPPDAQTLVPMAIGAAAGLLVGATSTGGGALLTPALILVAGVPPAIAIGTDVFIAGVMKLFGGGFYALRRELHLETVLRLSVGSVPGALVGMAIIGNMPVGRLDDWLTRALGGVLLTAGLAMLASVTLGRRWRPRRMPPAGVTVGLGFLTGVLVSMTSVGSGSLLLCVLALGYPLRAREMVGTDLVHALFLAIVATLGHAGAGRVDLGLAAAVLVGAIPAVLIGAQVATTAHDRPLRIALAVVLAAIGAPLAIFGP